MSAATTLPTTAAVCRLDDLVPERGAAVLVGDTQIALFRVDHAVFAIDHRDPFTGANVLARGIVGTAGDRWYVASPLHKQRFELETGRCLDDESIRVCSYATRVVDDVVHVEC